VVTQTSQTLPDATTVRGYQIHHGKVTVEGGSEFLPGEGCVLGSVAGSTWHGLFENDLWRRQYLASVAAATGRRFVASTSTNFALRREERIDAIADLIEEHLDMTSLLTLLDWSRHVKLPHLTLGLQS
jgi:adenosylcobyric acid synthase